MSEEPFPHDIQEDLSCLEYSNMSSLLAMFVTPNIKDTATQFKCPPKWKIIFIVHIKIPTPVCVHKIQVFEHRTFHLGLKKKKVTLPYFLQHYKTRVADGAMKHQYILFTFSDTNYNSDQSMWALLPN